MLRLVTDHVVASIAHRRAHAASVAARAHGAVSDGGSGVDVQSLVPSPHGDRMHGDATRKMHADILAAREAEGKRPCAA